MTRNPYETAHSQRDIDALARETPRTVGERLIRAAKDARDMCASGQCVCRLCSEIDADACQCAARATERASESVLAVFTRNAASGSERALSGPEIDPVTTIRATDDGSARLAGEDE